MSHSFTVAIEWESGSGGVARAEPRPELVVGSPTEFGGSDEVWSPEHQLVSSLGSCYMTTFVFFSNLLKMPLKSFKLDISGELEKTAEGPFWFKSFLIKPVFSFESEQPEAKIDNLLGKAKKYCLISNSLKSEIHVEASWA